MKILYMKNRPPYRRYRTGTHLVGTDGRVCRIESRLRKVADRPDGFFYLPHYRVVFLDNGEVMDFTTLFSMTPVKVYNNPLFFAWARLVRCLHSFRAEKTKSHQAIARGFSSDKKDIALQNFLNTILRVGSPHRQ